MINGTRIRTMKGVRGGGALKESSRWTPAELQSIDPLTLSKADRKLFQAEKARLELEALPEASPNLSIGEFYRDDKGHKKKMTNRAQKALMSKDFASYPHLLALKPREKYLFRSDYFEVDNSVSCILSFFHDNAAIDNFSPFWGINRIPMGLDSRVTTVLLDQVSRKGESWIDSHMKTSEKIQNLNVAEQADSGTSRTRRKIDKAANDLEIITAEIQDGAAYVNVHYRMLVKAPDLETLDESLELIKRLYIDRFSTIRAEPYHGEQRQELTGLFKRNKSKRGSGAGFTSTEFAGSYNLVTNGLDDPTGEHVGEMSSDVNSSAVVLDLDKFRSGGHVVVADSTVHEGLNRQYFSNMWLSKISQAALVNNRRVVHIILDNTNLNHLGPKFEGITYRVDMNRGDVNPFEIFGDRKHEVGLFSTQVNKIVLMAEQSYMASTGNDQAGRSIIANNLSNLLTDFYVDQGMWYRNAEQNRDRLRLVGIPHEDVPDLRLFIAYLDAAYKDAAQNHSGEQEYIKAIALLRGVFQTMLNVNGDLFNVHTSSKIDGISDGRRVVYDFAGLSERGESVAMAQLVNIVGFAVGSLGKDDTVFFHGCDGIDDKVKEFIKTQLRYLRQRGGRVVFGYNDVERMMADNGFNRFAAAEYTILGEMLPAEVTEYQRIMEQEIPKDLQLALTERRETDQISYLRRGQTNVVFVPDLSLGNNKVAQKDRGKAKPLQAVTASSSERISKKIQAQKEREMARAQKSSEAIKAAAKKKPVRTGVSASSVWTRR